MSLVSPPEFSNCAWWKWAWGDGGKEVRRGRERGRKGSVGWGRWGFPNSCFLRKSGRDNPGYRLHLADDGLFSFHLSPIEVTKASQLKLSARLLGKQEVSPQPFPISFSSVVTALNFLLTPVIFPPPLLAAYCILM